MNMSSPHIVGQTRSVGQYLLHSWPILAYYKNKRRNPLNIGEICYIIIENFFVRLPLSIKVVVFYNTFQNRFRRNPPPPPRPKFPREKYFDKSGHNSKKIWQISFCPLFFSSRTRMETLRIHLLLHYIPISHRYLV